MNRTALYIVAGLALLAVMRASSSATRVAIDDETGLPDVEPGASDADAFDDLLSDLPDLGDVPVSTDRNQNLLAFLYMLRRAEHKASDVANGNDYYTFFGGSYFTGLDDHPVITGEKKGVPLPPEWCRRLGFADGRCVSTAAGAYQFTKPTWVELRAAGAWGPRLDDFTQASQDEAARRLLLRDGALPYVLDGDLTNALRIASRRWASLPGSKAGQGGRSLAFVAQAFTEGLDRGMA